MLGRTSALLAPRGALYLFNQMPGWRQGGSAADLAGVLARHGFTVDEPLLGELASGPVVAIVART